MSYHTLRKLFAADTLDDPEKETLEWDSGEEGIEEWVGLSGAHFLGYRDPDLVMSGTPSFRVDGPVGNYTATFPMSHMDCGGASLHLVGDDGEAVIWVEDWLSGCLPKQYTDEGFGYGDPLVAEYITTAVERKVEEIGRKLGPEWHLKMKQPDEDSDQPASRAVWMKSARSSGARRSAPLHSIPKMWHTGSAGSCVI